MEIFKSFQVMGDTVGVKATNPKHFGFIPSEKTSAERGTFADDMGISFKDELAKVNSLQLSSDELTEKLAVSPDEVNIHDVMVASEKASLALNFTKAVRDKLINAYQTLMNLR